ncbi:MAG TPA: cohesin domain-containing protein [Clostridia bacterium]|nr:cohesin domain-containing protein [Clostridia bacterium]
MTRLTRAVMVLLIALAATLPAAADKAKSLFDKGRDAEARQQYEQAFDFYKQAYELKPKDVRYRSAFERLKFLSAASHVHRGQILREGGKLQEALKEFETAVQIDPSSFIAQQEVRRTRELIDQANNPGQRPRQQGLSDRVNQAAPPVELAPISNQPITLRLSEDTKVIYETIGKLAGINVLFDPDYTSRRIRIELNGVTLSEALEIVSLESKTFWRPVTANTIYVAANTKSKRTEVEQQVLRTFYISNLSSATELQDITNALRTVLELQRIQMLPTQAAIVVRGTIDQVTLAEKLINDIDKARAEVVVEVAVMQVSRDKLRQFGIQPPTTSSITLQSRGTTTTGTGTNGNGTGTGTTGTTSGINLNELANLDARNFIVNIPAATASFLFSDSNTKVLQNPQIRALDGQKATLKIGDRVPVATGSFQPGIGGVGINPLVNTQFQYIDVGVNIDVTPHVYANRDVGMKVMLEISAVTRTANIGGIEQPVIGQRRIEHEIRLKEGEVNLLGGILEDSDIRSMSGLPWVSQIPILKYLFGRESVERINNEIVFVLVPRVVRAQEVTDLNQRTLDIGTANAIEMRRLPPAPAQQTPPAPPAQQPATVPPQQPPQQQPGAPVQPQVNPQPQGAPAPNGSGGQAQAQPQQAQQLGAMGSGAILGFDPPTVNAASGSTFAVNVTLSGGHNVFSAPVQIMYDSRLMQLLNVSNGGALSRDGQAVALVHRDDAQSGSVQVTASRPPGAPGVTAEGTVFTLTFQAKAPGQGNLAIHRAVLRDPAMTPMTASGSQAVVTIR